MLWLWLFNIVFTLLLLGGAFYLWRKTAKIKSSIDWDKTSAYSLISIAVPKQNDKTPQAAEQMFAALHGISRPSSNEADQPKISFEIVAKKQKIIFYVYIPTALRDFVISQIYAQYPTVEIKELSEEEDYTIFETNKAVVATQLDLKKEPYFPIKTFNNFEVDPLSGITSALSSIGRDEEVWIQFIMRPIDDSWQDKGEVLVKEIREPSPKTAGVFELIGNEAKTFVVDFAKSVINPGAAGENKENKDKAKEKGGLSGPMEQAVKAIEEKITKLGYAVNIRILAAALDEHSARIRLEQTVGAFKQFNSLNLNSLVVKDIVTDPAVVRLFKARDFGSSNIIFNITELASLYHFPSETVQTPTIEWAGSRKGEPPANLPVKGSLPADELTIFAKTNFRGSATEFGIKKNDRRLHTYIIGKTGTGKSTLMENMIIDDIHEGRGLAVVDPHGDLIKHVLCFIPKNRIEDVIYFNPADRDYPGGFNVMENVNPEMKAVVASGVVGVFKKIFGESWGPRLEYILRNAILGVLDYPNSTLLGVMRVLTDTSYRRLVVSQIKDPVIKDFFINEYEKYDPKFRQEAIAPIQNKVGQFLSSAVIRNIVGQPKSTFKIDEVMNSGKILLVDLSIGKIGEDNSALLGAMLITKIQLAAMSRAYINEEERRDFYLYVDEFQNFATDSFAVILSEARKYRLNLIMTNQYILQMPETVANAVFGNVGTMIAFRIGASDATALVKEFEPVFNENDLVNLANYHIYLKMAIDGVTVPAFSAVTLPPRTDAFNYADLVIENSRRTSTRPRQDVEDYIAEWSEPVALNDNSMKAPNLATKIENKAGERERQIELLRDRFDRDWYAVPKNVLEKTKVKKDTDTKSQSGGRGEEEPLITWEKAHEIGIKVLKPEKNEADIKSDDNQFLPIEEIK